MAPIRKTLHDLAELLGREDHSGRSRPLRILLHTLRAFYWAGRKFRRDLCFERAAALSFISLLSVIPVGFLFLFFMT